MSSFKKNLVNNIALIVILVFTFVHLLLLFLNVFGISSIQFFDGFNYFTEFVLVVISLVLYITCFFIEKITNLKIPSWFEVVFYVAFFLFTNTYYCIGAYSNIFAVAILFAYLSFLVTIINISVFYHTQKDENTKLKASRNYIITSIFFYSVATNALIELFVTAIKLFAFPYFELTTVNSYIVEFCSMVLVTIIMCILLNLSLMKSKRFINACLIRKVS